MARKNNELQNEDNVCFSGILEKELIQGKPQWFFKTRNNEKLPLSKIYDENNTDTLKLREGEFCKELVSDKNGGFIVLPWSF